MKSFSDLLASMLPRPVARELNDPVLGILKWDARQEVWMSQPLPTESPVVIWIYRRRRALAPTDDCLQVAREIARDPTSFEEQVRSELRLEASRRPEHMRNDILQLKATCITLFSEPGWVTGHILLDGESQFSNWYIWHNNGSPRGVTQQWE